MNKFFAAGLTAMALLFASPVVSSADAHVLDCTTARYYATGFYGDNDVAAEIRSGVDPGSTSSWWWGSCDRPWGSATYQDHRVILEIVFPTHNHPQGVRSRVWVMFRDGGIVDNPNYIGPPAGW